MKFYKRGGIIKKMHRWNKLALFFNNKNEHNKIIITVILLLHIVQKKCITTANKN